MLVARAGPRDPAIRSQLAVEDVEWRQTHHGLLLERLFSSDRELVIYQRMMLDAPDEWAADARPRRRGAGRAAERARSSSDDHACVAPGCAGGRTG